MTDFLLSSRWASCRGGSTRSSEPQSVSPAMVGVVVGFLFSIAIQAQPALRNAVINDRGIASRQQNRARSFTEVEGVEAGPVRFSLSASYSVEFNDNVNYSENNPQGDFIQTPSVRLTIDAPISQRSDLSFQIGVGYSVYWHNEDLSRLRIAPGSELAYDLQVRDVFITLFDRFDYTDTVYTAPDIANEAQVPRFVNTIGTQVTWVPDKWLVSAGYSFELTRSIGDEFGYLDRDTHLPFLRTGYIFANGAASSGLEFSVTFTDYKSNLTSDSSIVSFGPYLDWQISDAIRASARGGFLYTVNSLTLLPEDSFDANSFYLGLDASQSLTDHISHGLGIYHGVRPSYQQGAAFTEATSVSYQADWAFMDPASLGFNLGYVHGQQSFAAGFAPSEVYDQWRIGVGLSYALTERFSGRLSYDYVLRDSDQPNRNYTQNRVTLGLSYRFQ